MPHHASVLFTHEETPYPVPEIERIRKSLRGQFAEDSVEFRSYGAIANGWELQYSRSHAVWAVCKCCSPGATVAGRRRIVPYANGGKHSSIGINMTNNKVECIFDVRGREVVSDGYQGNAGVA